MEDRAETECGMPAKAFRTAATAYHKDQVSKKREELSEQMDAFERIENDA
jgi:hypothetical protein